MGPSCLKRWKFKLRGSKSPSPHSPASIADSTLPSSTCDTLATTLKERLWNQAYDELRSKEPKTFEAYQKLLSAELLCKEDDTTVTVEDEIKPEWQARRHQMETLVGIGLRKTEKAAAVNSKVDGTLKSISLVKEVIGKALQASPEAALAWVGVSLALEILQNPFAEPGIQRSGLAYVVSMMEWYWNLTDLLLDQNQIRPDLEGLRGQLEKHIVELYQKLLLYQMQSICLSNKKRMLIFVRDIIKVDDWAGQVEDIKAAESAVRRDSEQYTSQRARQDLSKVEETARSQLQELQNIAVAIEDQTRRQEEVQHDRDDRKCLDDLFETNPDDDKKRIEETKGGLFRDSYRWILDHSDYQRWYKDKQERLLWIGGDPGKGKTMLLCGIIDELDNDHSIRISYFFCQATNRILNNATAVLRGLIYTLARRYPKLIQHVRKRYDGGGGKRLFEGLNAWVVMSEILEAMLHDPTLDNIFLVVDALDECVTDLPKLLDFIIQKSSSAKAKWVVSSRNWPEIEERFNNSVHRISLELNAESIAAAVRVYTKHKVEKLAKLKAYDKATSDNLEKHLIAQSDSTFLWVALVCEELTRYGGFPRDTIEVLETLPPGLTPLYERMVQNINIHMRKRCNKVLAMVLVVYRPVTLQELLSMVPIDLSIDELEKVVASCGSLLTLREGTVSLVHQSAKDFLLNPDMKVFRQILPSGIAHQHHLVFSRSLERLNSTLKRDIYELHLPGMPIEDVSPPTPDPLAPVKYSCAYWVKHLEDSKPGERLAQGDMQDSIKIYEFLRCHYLHWLEAQSLLRGMSEAVVAMRQLEVLVEHVPKQLVELVHDGLRFVLFYKQCIEKFPLQLYVTGLLLSPTRSIVRRLFQAEAPTWVTVTTKIEENWDACLQTLEGHQSMVCSVAFSPDGCQLASAAMDDTVKIWDITTGQCRQTLDGCSWHTPVSFSPDGKKLAMGCNHGLFVRIYNTITGQIQWLLEDHSSMVHSVAFSSDSKQLASGSRDTTIKLWNMASGQCQRTLESHSKTVKSVAFSPNGHQLASSSDDGTICLWDITTGQCQQTLKGHNGPVTSVAFFPAGCLLISGSHCDETFKFWDTTTGLCQRTLEGNMGISFACSPDGRHIASDPGRQLVKIWDAVTGECLHMLKADTSYECSVAFSPDGHQIASASRHNIKIWDIATEQYRQTIEGEHTSFITSFSFSPDKRLLVSGSFDNTAKVWDVATGECQRTLQDQDSCITSIAFSPDGLNLALGYRNAVTLWNTTTWHCQWTLETPERWTGLRKLDFSPNGCSLAVGDSKSIKFYDPATGLCQQTLHCDDDIASVAFSPDGTQLASHSDTLKNAIELWDTNTGQRQKVLNTYGLMGLELSFLTEHHVALECDMYQPSMLWDTTTGQRFPEIYGKLLALSPDGRQLASICRDGILKIWDLSKGECHQTSKYLHTTEREVQLRTQKSSLGILEWYQVLSAREEWVRIGSQNLIWLPPEYRAEKQVVDGSKIAIGCNSGRVSFMEFYL